MINLKVEILKLKNESIEYNRAIDDVLEIWNNQFKTCRITHRQTGLFFNGFSDPNYQRGKNTLSSTNFAKIIVGNKTDKEILETTFQGHILNRDGVQLVYNNIVYAGSEIAKILSEYYSNTAYLPIDDFIVDRDFK